MDVIRSLLLVFHATNATKVDLTALLDVRFQETNCRIAHVTAFRTAESNLTAAGHEARGIGQFLITHAIVLAMWLL